jgi:hypothetical protein
MHHSTLCCQNCARQQQKQRTRRQVDVLGLLDAGTQARVDLLMRLLTTARHTARRIDCAAVR